jgi:hypothetical protein
MGIDSSTVQRASMIVPSDLGTLVPPLFDRQARVLNLKVDPITCELCGPMDIFIEAQAAHNILDICWKFEVRESVQDMSFLEK